MAQPDPKGDDKGVGVNVLHLLERSDALQAAAASLLAQATATSTRRDLLAVGMGAVSLEHWGAQRILLRAGHYVTGFALVRLQFEAVVRTIWILECAKDDWLERFVTPMASEQLGEPVLGPPVPAMLSAIATKAPVIAEMLSQLKEGPGSRCTHTYMAAHAPSLTHSWGRLPTKCQRSSGTPTGWRLLL